MNPPRFKGNPIVREVRCAGITPVSVYPPIRLAYTAALLEKNNFNVKILDANAFDDHYEDVKEKIKEYDPDLVLFTTSVTTISFDAKVADITKEINKNIIVVLDDPHIAPVMPEKVLTTFKNIDILILGESEFVTLDLVKNIKDLKKIDGIVYRYGDEIIKNNPAKPGDINELPNPAYHLLPIKKYYSLTFARKKPFATIITSVGCPYKCDFCIIGGSTIWRGYGGKWRAKTAEKILDEVEYLYEKFKIKDFYFFDETFTVDKKRVIDVCNGLVNRGLKIRWACNSRVDTVDQEMLELMKKTGCWNICYGVESGSETLLNNIHKEITLERAKHIFNVSKKLGLNPSASFMLGLPGENWKTIKETLQFAIKLDPVRAQFVITTPYPGTKLYDYVKKEGLLKKDYSFSGYDAYCVDAVPVMSTKEMTAEELLKAQKYVYKKFYLRPLYALKTLFSANSITEFINLLKFWRYI